MSGIARFSLGICASVVLLSVVCPSIAADCPKGPVLFCYYASWSIYRTGLGKYDINMINSSLCTHMVYAFAGLNLEGYTFSLDAFNDLPEAGGAGQYYLFRSLREENPCLKIMLSIGGWGEGSEKFSIMAETKESRSRFIEHLLRFLVYYGFDGVDIDWEYPSERGGISDDKKNFPLLLSEMKARLHPRGKQIATAVAAGTYNIESGYDVTAIADSVDYVLLMAYDYHRTDVTSHVAPLYKIQGDPNTGSVDESVKIWLSKGCPARKLVLGVLSSGRSFELSSSTSNGLGAAVKGPGQAGELTSVPGFLAYYEICDMLFDSRKWNIVKNDTYANTYAYNGTQWITFEEPSTLKLKAEYALREGLAGVMLYSIDTDDFFPLCDEKYSLHAAIREGLNIN